MRRSLGSASRRIRHRCWAGKSSARDYRNQTGENEEYHQNDDTNPVHRSLNPGKVPGELRAHDRQCQKHRFPRYTKEGIQKEKGLQNRNRLSDESKSDIGQSAHVDGKVSSALELELDYGLNGAEENDNTDDKASNGLPSQSNSRPLDGYDPHEYSVGLICALPDEYAAIRLALDQEYSEFGNECYRFGRISGHKVVIACLPAGRYGTNTSAVVATRMSQQFPSIQFGLLVGIGGGVPGGDNDVCLGDVVVSQPGGIHGGVVQYDQGKFLEGCFERTGDLQPPPDVLLHALNTVMSNHFMGINNVSSIIQSICRRSARFMLDDRLRSNPKVHYGTIASGNAVIKDAATRDYISNTLGGVLCFEMEAAGLMNNFPCLVIRGVCDFADEYKDKVLQPYAAAAAAAYAKELLSVIRPADVAATKSALQVTSGRY
ncbi:MAG: hypothetical protein M1820_006572 [Bogoriella megaspora]|nr:MAG: hypothetical protein M1820_006572 [Bogoriella megaspora]